MQGLILERVGVNRSHTRAGGASIAVAVRRRQRGVGLYRRPLFSSLTGNGPAHHGDSGIEKRFQIFAHGCRNRSRTEIGISYLSFSSVSLILNGCFDQSKYGQRAKSSPAQLTGACGGGRLLMVYILPLRDGQTTIFPNRPQANRS